MAESLFFYFFAILSVVGGILVVTHKNPVTSAISLVLTLFCSAVLFILLHAHFVAAVQVLVYAGAIIVLFLFTVMFLNIREDSLGFDAVNIPRKITVLSILMVVTGYLVYRISRISFPDPPVLISDSEFGTVEAVGRSMFVDHVLQFELASILLVAAIVGVVVLAKKGDY